MQVHPATKALRLGAFCSAVCQSLACALTSTEVVGQRRSRGGACRRAEAGGAAVGRRAHDRDRRRLRHPEHHHPGRSGRSDRCGQPGARTLGREQPEPAKPGPAVPVRRSIRDNHLVCLVCGKQLKTLRRHLEVAHQLTPDAYRERFGLKPDYPMAAPGYSRQRSEMARRVGLGRREQARRGPQAAQRRVIVSGRRAASRMVPVGRSVLGLCTRIARRRGGIDRGTRPCDRLRDGRGGTGSRLTTPPCAGAASARASAARYGFG